MNPASALRLGAKLFFKRRGTLPELLAVFVTNRCPLRCRHCFYVKQMKRRTDEMTRAQMETLAASIGRIGSVVLTGGEPLERTDLADLIGIWLRPDRAQVVAVATSGYFPDRLARTLEEVYSREPEAQLDVGLSLDGPEKVHDRIRQRAGCYRRAMESYRVLEDVRRRHPGLRIHLLLTFSAFNQQTAADSLLRWDRELKPDSLGVTLIRGEVPDPAAHDFDVELYREVQKVVEDRSKFEAILDGQGIWAARLGRMFTRLRSDLTVRTLREQRRIMACYAGRLSAVVYPDGRVHACEILDSPLGDLGDFSYDLSRLLRSDRAWTKIEELARSDCFCTHECNMTPNLLFNPHLCAKLILGHLSGDR